MAAALVGSKGAVSTSASGGSVTPAWGTSENRTAGNLLILWVAGYETGTLPSAPSGWSVNANSQKAGSDGQCSISVFYKIAAGSDAAPTVAGVASTILVAQLAEYSGNVTSAVIDRNPAGVTGITSPRVVTAGTADTFPKELVIVAAAVHKDTAATNAAGAHTLNNGASASSTNNNGTSTTTHYDFAHGITTGKGSADSDSYAFTTTFVDDTALVLASFKIAVVAASALGETLTLGTSGVRTRFGASALAEVLTFITAGIRKVLGASALTETLTFVTAGVRKTFGASAVQETLTFTTAGTRTVYGASSMTSTFTATTPGTRTTFGASALDLTDTLTTGGTVGHYGASDFALTDTLTTAGVRETFGASSLDETLTLTTLVEFGSSAFDLTLTFTTAGQVSTVYPAATGGTLTHAGNGDLTAVLLGRISAEGRGRLTRSGDGHLTKATP